MADLDIPPAWDRAADQIAKEGRRKILVMGASNIGKSSFCGFLAQRLLDGGVEVGVVDADIGQKDIGPPATVTLGYPRPAMALEEVAPEAFFFVGNTSPVGRLLPLAIGAARLSREARTPVVVVNTTGYIHGGGRVLKGYKIEAVQPDVIVAIARSRELASILSAYRYVPTIQLKPSRRARAKDWEERMLVRERGFAKYFKGASRHEFETGELVFQRALLFTGEPFQTDTALYAERTAEGLVVVSERGQKPPPDAQVIAAGFEKSLLCGIGDERGRGVGLGIMEAIDFANGTVSLFTPVDRDRIRLVQFGDLYLALDGRELGRVSSQGF